MTSGVAQNRLGKLSQIEFIQNCVVLCSNNDLSHDDTKLQGVMKRLGIHKISPLTGISVGTDEIKKRLAIAIVNTMLDPLQGVSVDELAEASIFPTIEDYFSLSQAHASFTHESLSLALSEKANAGKGAFEQETPLLSQVVDILDKYNLLTPGMVRHFTRAASKSDKNWPTALAEALHRAHENRSGSKLHRIVEAFYKKALLDSCTLPLHQAVKKFHRQNQTLLSRFFNWVASLFTTVPTVPSVSKNWYEIEEQKRSQMDMLKKIVEHWQSLIEVKKKRAKVVINSLRNNIAINKKRRQMILQMKEDIKSLEAGASPNSLTTTPSGMNHVSPSGAVSMGRTLRTSDGLDISSILTTPEGLARKIHFTDTSGGEGHNGIFGIPDLRGIPARVNPSTNHSSFGGAKIRETSAENIDDTFGEAEHRVGPEPDDTLNSTFGSAPRRADHPNELDNTADSSFGSAPRRATHPNKLDNTENSSFGGATRRTDHPDYLDDTFGDAEVRRTPAHVTASTNYSSGGAEIREASTNNSDSTFGEAEHRLGPALNDTTNSSFGSAPRRADYPKGLDSTANSSFGSAPRRADYPNELDDSENSSFGSAPRRSEHPNNLDDTANSSFGVAVHRVAAT